MMKILASAEYDWDGNVISRQYVEISEKRILKCFIEMADLVRAAKEKVERVGIE